MTASPLDRAAGQPTGPGTSSPIVRMASGFNLTTRVGLGSPKIDFGKDWNRPPRRGSEPPGQEGYLINGDDDFDEVPQETEESVTEEVVPEERGGDSYFPSPSKSQTPNRRSLINAVSGLPSPPGTNSDIVVNGRAVPSLMAESPPASFDRPARPTASRTPSMTSSASRHSSLAPASNSPRVRALRPHQRDPSADLSRSISSASSLSTKSLRPKGVVETPRRSSTDLIRQASIASTSSHKSSQRGSVSPSKRSAASSSSRHHHSPSVPHDFSPSPQKPVSDVWSASPTESHLSHSRASAHSRLSSSRRSSHGPSPSGSYAKSPLQHPHLQDLTSPSPPTSYQGRPSQPRRFSSGRELDQRILAAEEKVRQSAYSRVGHHVTREKKYPLVSPEKAALHTHDSYSRPSGQEAKAETGVEGFRRSATSSGLVGRAGPQMAKWNEDEGQEQERSGGSGGSRHRKPLPQHFRNDSLFTPSPKNSIQATSSRRDDHQHPISPTANFSRFSTDSRLSRDSPANPSPASPRSFGRTIDGLERSSSVSSPMDRHRWSESVSGLPRRHLDEGDGNHPHVSLSQNGLLGRRAESVMGETSSVASRRSHNLAPRLSRLSLAPGDSVSAIGTREDRTTPTNTSHKDPLEVLRRLEASRQVHNRHWDAERSMSAMGEHITPRPGSGPPLHIASPERIRPATSLSSLRDQYRAPRTEPVDRVHRRPYDEVGSPLNRTTSRMSNMTATEPRPRRSNTSLGGRASVHLDVSSASTEHGRLLYEACRALEIKLPHDAQIAFPDLVRAFASAARSAETTNAAVRHALSMASQAQSSEDTRHVAEVLREAGRSSDQNVRDLTRVMLDVPKLLRDGSRMTSSTTGSVRSERPYEPRRSPLSPHESPIRRSEDVPRSATSMSDIYENETPRRRTRDSLPPNFGSSGPDSRAGDYRSTFLSKVRNLAGNRSSPREALNLSTIEDSPPTAKPEVFPVRALKKKASSTSTHTVKAGTFLPTTAGQATTALSTVMAEPMSPTVKRSVSVRSTKQLVGEGEGSPGSPASRFSFYTAEDHPSMTSIRVDDDEVADEGPSTGEDTVLAGLVAAQRVREEGGEDKLEQREGKGKGSEGKGDAAPARKWSVSDKFRATLRRGKE